MNLILYQLMFLIGLETLEIMYSLPYALLMWGEWTFHSEYAGGEVADGGPFLLGWCLS